MALEAQGTLVRRISTAAGSTGVSGSSAAVINATVSTAITRSDLGDFTADGFTTSMRLTFPNSTLNTGVYGIISVAATVIGLFNAVSTFSTSAGTISVQGNEYGNIGSIIGFNGPDGAAGEIDITNLQSTAKEFIPGLRDEGSLSLDILYDPASTSLHSALQTDRANRTKRSYEIVYTDVTPAAASQPTADNFDAYVMSFARTGAVDDAVKGTITLRISSAVKTITAVAS